MSVFPVHQKLTTYTGLVCLLCRFITFPLPFHYLSITFSSSLTDHSGHIRGPFSPKGFDPYDIELMQNAYATCACLSVNGSVFGSVKTK